MNQSTLDKLKQLRDDFSYYAPRLLKIRSKDGKLIDFSLNTMQRKIDSTIERLKAESKPVRIIILKYRQGGASTYTEGRIFHATSMNKLTNSLIVAHEEAASTNLFNMSKVFYDELPNELKPMRKNSNSKEIVFENPTTDAHDKQQNPGLRSRIKISTAKNTDAGRSATIHNLHASEVAFWDDAEKAMLSLMQAVPNTPNTMVILESTANGVGGYFYDQWQRAKNGESDFVPLFFAWFEEPNYRMAVPDGFTLTPEEQELKRKYNLEDEQLVWRRWCIANNCGGDPELFKQEYPSNDMEAFLVSGRPRFDVQVLMEYLQQCEDGKRGYLERVGSRIQFIEDKHGPLEVWEEPQKYEYYIGADVSKGLATGDNSAAPVFSNRYSLDALWHGKTDPDLFAGDLFNLGMWYNEALLTIEENNHGLTVINKLKPDYWNLYKRTSHNKLTDEVKQEIGWYTSEQTKRLAIDHLAKCIRERRLKIKSRKFIEECLTYVIEDDGKTNAQQGCYDDIVMAAAIDLYVMDQFATPVHSQIVATVSRAPETKQTFIVQPGGGVRHISEIEDEKHDDGEWFRKAGW
ncbi:DNA packaging protein [Paenibacillus alkalitolerans]|uniref:DNA packaging protein n=1 Tax=Paenibacillus alkalitolerans TaxID=2799335 RepID=UPI0018F4EBA2|nr:DNA packaging protein [Paenibacillus alkalitolerans]